MCSSDTVRTRAAPSRQWSADDSTTASMPDRSTRSISASSSSALTRNLASGRLLGFVDQHDGDVVFHGVDVATLPHAIDLLLGLAILDLAVAVGTDQDLEKLLIEGHRVPSGRDRALILPPADQGEDLVSSRLADLGVSRLD